jgi:FAD/FMN-containing dehydrogenase
MIWRDEMEQQPQLEVRNWFGDIPFHPRVVVRPGGVDDVVAIVQDSQTYPAPVHAAGSNHSVTGCIIADGGTVVDMTAMSRILRIGNGTVTVEAGAQPARTPKIALLPANTPQSPHTSSA